MQVFERKGLVFRANEELLVDAHGMRGKEALVTHAHSDHAKPTKSNSYFMTPETASLIEADKKNLSVKKTPFKKKFSLGGFECRFHNSGHILGSAQVEVNNSANAVLTSDFKLQKSILFGGAEILPSEILVIETTFGSPEYKFPRRDLVYEGMIRWMNYHLKKNRFIVLGGYSTGKAQELTKIVNEFLGETPLVYKRVFGQNKTYEKEGVKLGNYLELNHNLDESNILIMPPHLINDDLLSALEHQLKRRVEPAIATGWRNTRYKTFPLSDHADYYDLLQYVERSEPKLVFTTHGFEEEFAKSVRRRLKINARPLSKAGQKTISEFAVSN